MSYNSWSLIVCVVEMINEYALYWEITDLFNNSYYNWKPKLVLVSIHNFSTSLIISDDISETND